MRRRIASLVAATVMAIAAGLPALAVQPGERLADPELEARARALSTEVRCLVCQNQSIDDSDAQLAKDLRILVRERIAAGDSDGEVLDFLVARYGEFVLLKPRFDGSTLVLWLAGPALLLAGLVAAAVAYRRRAGAGDGPAEPRLTREEEERLERLLDRGENKASS